MSTIIYGSSSADRGKKDNIYSGSGDNVMAELQSKLKGRGKINPTHSQSIREATSKTSNNGINADISTPCNGTIFHSIKKRQIHLQKATEDKEERENSGSHSPTAIRINITAVVKNEDERSTTTRKSSLGKSIHEIQENIKDKKLFTNASSSPVFDDEKAMLTTPSSSFQLVRDMQVSSSLPLSLDCTQNETEASGVRELARIFNDNSKGETTPKLCVEASREMSAPCNYEVDTSNGVNKSNSQIYTDHTHPYQNISNNGTQPTYKSAPTNFSIIAMPKKPMPTPRRFLQGSSTETGMVKTFNVGMVAENRYNENENDVSDAYELIEPPLKEQLKAIDHPQVTPISDSTRENVTHATIMKSTSSSGNIPHRNTQHLFRDLRKGVVTDGINEEEYIKMGMTDSALMKGHTNNGGTSYLTVISDGLKNIDANKYITMKQMVSSNSQVCLTTLTQNDHTHQLENKFSQKDETVSVPTSLDDQTQSMPTQIESTSIQKEQKSQYRSRIISQPKINKIQRQKFPPLQKRQHASQATSTFSSNHNKGWKRSQGSIFAQEMIDTLYCQIPNKVQRDKYWWSNDKRGQNEDSCRVVWGDDMCFDSEGDSESYIDVNEIPSAKPTLIVSEKQATPPTVPSRPLIGPSAPKIEYLISSDVLCPPVIPPKSESMLREVERSNEQVPLPSMQPKKVIRKKLKSNKSLPINNTTVNKGDHVVSSPIISSPVLTSSYSASQNIAKNNSDNNVRNLIRVLRKETLADISDQFTQSVPLPHRILDSDLITSTVHTEISSNESPIKLSPNDSSFQTTPPTSQNCKKLLLERKGVVKRRPKKHGHVNLVEKINRNSLEIILQNHDFIMKHLKEKTLKKEKSHDSIKDTQQHKLAEDPTNKETLVQSLGNILVEISALMDNSSTQNDEKGGTLTSTIENELCIKLHTNPSYLQRTDHSHFHLDSDEVSKDYYEVLLTDDDVKNVVKYVDSNCVEQSSIQSSLQAESNFSSSFDNDDFTTRNSFLRRSYSNNDMLSDSNNKFSHSLSDSEIILPVNDNPSSEFPQEDVRTNENYRPIKRQHSLSVVNDIHNCTSNATSTSVGYYTDSGGTMTNKYSGVTIEIPPGAVPKGRRQKIWFEVHQTVYKESDKDDLYSLFSSNKRTSEGSSKKDQRIQLTPIISIGPSDIMLNKPLKINIPHCVPIDSSSWNLKVKGRGHSSRDNDWISLSPSSSTFFTRPSQVKGRFKSSTYQLHPNHVRIKTKLPGYYRLMGRPLVANSNKVHKKMVCSIYTDYRIGDEILIKIFFVNAILDCVESLDNSLTSEGYYCIERNIPLLCYGNQYDFEITLSKDTPCGLKEPLQTQIIPYAMLWKAARVGYSQVSFNLCLPFSLTSCRSNGLYSLTVMQSNIETLNMNFMLPQI